MATLSRKYRGEASSGETASPRASFRAATRATEPAGAGRLRCGCRSASNRPRAASRRHRSRCLWPPSRVLAAPAARSGHIGPVRRQPASPPPCASTRRDRFPHARSSATSTRLALACSASARKEGTGTTGRDAPRASPWAMPQAIRRPVNEPDPGQMRTRPCPRRRARRARGEAAPSGQALGVLMGARISSTKSSSPRRRAAEQSSVEVSIARRFKGGRPEG